MIELALLMAVSGLFAGVLSGLFGVGGGIILVPVLDYALGFTELNPVYRMHVAVATSLAVVMFTTFSSAYAHYKKGSADLALVKRWGLFIMLGSLLGIAAATVSSSQFLSILFGVLTLLVALKMLLPMSEWRLANAVPTSRLSYLIPAAIGGFSSMMGIGGGTLGVPTLNLLNFPMQRAVGTAAGFGVLISIPGSIGYIVSGWSVQALPSGYLGYINLIGLALVAPLAVVMAPFGARLAHRLSARQLQQLFGGFLFLVAARMFIKVLM